MQKTCTRGTYFTQPHSTPEPQECRPLGEQRDFLGSLFLRMPHPSRCFANSLCGTAVEIRLCVVRDMRITGMRIGGEQSATSVGKKVEHPKTTIPHCLSGIEWHGTQQSLPPPPHLHSLCHFGVSLPHFEVGVHNRLPPTHSEHGNENVEKG